ncbi:MAG TPA: efflux transporter outer membrane subunit [Caulobacter sp.]|nr:efflux transporter outer membrane subunit [Caulobacter sp.]
MSRSLIAIALAASTALSACTLAPRYEPPALAVAQAWPDGGTDQAGESAAGLDWREVYLDPKLQAVIALALEENRDLRVAVLNIEKARSQHRIQRAALVPGLDAQVSGARGRTPGDLAGTGSAVESESWNASVGVTAYELDLFGRVRSLNEAALQSYLATAETRRAVQVSLIAETATAYLTLAADQDLLKLARETLASREEGLRLTRSRHQAGATSLLEVRQAETLAEQARADVGAYGAQVAQDRNALRLLVGTEVPAELAPASLDQVAIRSDLPAGLPSDVLRRRPDVLAAEHTLKGMNANIGAARAAYFPRINLTGNLGSASADLSGLFGGGSGAWSFAPSISLPIFDGGARAANLAGARTDREIALAQYDRTVQVAFREVSDALAVKSSIDGRLEALARLLVAATHGELLSRSRYEQGVDSYLVLLDAQRTRYSAEQALISIKLTQAGNLATLYKALGGGAPA